MKENGKWFYTGHYMSDEKTPRTVYVEGESNIEDAIKKGLKFVEAKKVKVKKVLKKEKKSKV